MNVINEAYKEIINRRTDSRLKIDRKKISLAILKFKYIDEKKRLPRMPGG